MDINGMSPGEIADWILANMRADARAVAEYIMEELTKGKEGGE